MVHELTVLGERGFLVGSIFKRKDSGSEMVSGIISLRCIWRQWTAWAFVKGWLGCNFSYTVFPKIIDTDAKSKIRDR